MKSDYQAYLQLCKEQESLYHQIALSLGLPDSVLCLLYTMAERGDRQNPSRLYSDWSLSKQTGHSALEWIKKKGWVTLTPDPEDRRGKLVVLTQAGKNYIQTNILPILQAEQRAFFRLRPEQRDRLTRLLRQTIQYFKEEMAATAGHKTMNHDDPTL